MKSYLEVLLLTIITLLSLAVICLRLQGAMPTQIPNVLTYGILVVNVLWVIWCSRFYFQHLLMTRKGKS